MGRGDVFAYAKMMLLGAEMRAPQVRVMFDLSVLVLVSATQKD